MEIFVQNPTQNLENGNVCSKSDSKPGKWKYLIKTKLKSAKWKYLFEIRLKTWKMEIFYSFKVKGPTTADVDPATFKAESVVQPTEP